MLTEKKRAERKAQEDELEQEKAKEALLKKQRPLEVRSVRRERALSLVEPD